MIELDDPNLPVYVAEPTGPVRGGLSTHYAASSTTRASSPASTAGIGVLGFCFGGSYSFALAAADPRVKVAVPFYGAPPELSVVEAIHGPVLAF